MQIQSSRQIFTVAEDYTRTVSKMLLPENVIRPMAE
jgi:hypothetical protein